MADTVVLGDALVVASGADAKRTKRTVHPGHRRWVMGRQSIVDGRAGKRADAPRTAPVRRSGSAGVASADGRADAVL